jgi:ribosomal-protein-alanine N-acetyltransferase
MMVEIMQEAIRLGARLATLEVREHNAAAQRLYQRFRFKIVGRRPRYYLDNQEDALIMTVDGLDEAYLDWLAGIDWAGDSAEI